MNRAKGYLLAIGLVVGHGAAHAEGVKVGGQDIPSVEVNWSVLDRLGPVPTLADQLKGDIPTTPLRQQLAPSGAPKAPVAFQPYKPERSERAPAANPPAVHKATESKPKAAPKPAPKPVVAEIAAPAEVPAATPVAGMEAPKPAPAEPAQAKPAQAEPANAEPRPAPVKPVTAKAEARPAVPAKANLPIEVPEPAQPVAAPAAKPEPVAVAARPTPIMPEPAAVATAPAPQPAAAPALVEPAPAAVAALPPQPAIAAPALQPAAPAASVVSTGDTMSIRFAAEAARLPDAALADLRTLAGRMERDEGLNLQLLAFAEGDDANASKARRLSLSRALEVRKFLMEQGVRSTRIEVRALGHKSDGGFADRVDAVLVAR